jgi:hypothetical protein
MIEWQLAGNNCHLLIQVLDSLTPMKKINNRLVQILIICMVVTVLPGVQLSAAPDSSFTNTRTLLLTNAEEISVQSDKSNHAAVNSSCCKDHSGMKTGCKHCTGNTCKTGPCHSCSHCLTAITENLFFIPLSEMGFVDISENRFLTVFQVTDPRPPRT